MSPSLSLWGYASCALILSAVAWIAYRYSRGQTDSRAGYFLAGRGLPGAFIAGSLLLTNLSAEQLVGLSGSAYAFNLSAMAWEVTAGVAIIVMAMVFLPRFLALGFTTLPEFFERRFDARVRRLSAVLFVVGYTLITIPSVLYAGSLAVLAITGLALPLPAVMIFIALLGAGFAVGGGLRAIAISDTLFGVGLLVMAVALPLLALSALGDGSVSAGLSTLTSVHTEKLNAIGGSSDPVPFGTLFTGMILANLFYWGTNQYVIQRTLGARNLAAGQQGVLAAGFFKLLVPYGVMIPGVIAYHMFGEDLGNMDAAYPTLVSTVLPPAMTGVFLAVLLGVVVSSFNSLLNSAATILTLDLGSTTADPVRRARLWSVAITVFAIIVAPNLEHAPDGLWQLIRRFTGFYNIPTIALVIAALFLPRVTARGAIAAVTFHIAAYGLIALVLDTGWHFVHVYGGLFVVEIGIMLALGGKPGAMPAPGRQHIDLTPWRWRWVVCALLITGMLGTYWVFSPLGVAS